MTCKFNVDGMCVCDDNNVSMRGSSDACYGMFDINEEQYCTHYVYNESEKE